jgi:hypothetical protein
MNFRSATGILTAHFVLVLASACGSDSSPGGGNDTGGTTGSTGGVTAGSGGQVTSSGGTVSSGGTTVGAGGGPATGGVTATGGATTGTGGMTTASGGATASGGTSASGGATTTGGTTASGGTTATGGTTGTGGGTGAGTSLTGTLGALGAVKPIVSSFVISNSGETLIYLSTAPMTCQTLSTSRWLGTLPADSQVVELVVPASKATGTVNVAAFGGAEVNYAPGGKSSAYEKNAASGSVTFTSCAAQGPCEGSVTATYANPTGNVAGTFHAEFCAGGQQY